LKQKLLECLEVEPSEPARAEIIWLHGLGADGYDFEPLIPMLGLSGVRVTLPHAPEMPVTINGGAVMPAWYDIRSLGDSPDRESAEDIEASAKAINALLDRAAERVGGSERVALVGFSQGGAMALHVGLRYPQRLAGIAFLSAYLVLPERLISESAAANHETSLLACHGRYDPLVPLARGRRAFDAVQALNPTRPASWHEYSMGHEVCPSEIDAIANWLHKVLA
jgi:phospholipase/carboxylesterase